MARHFVVALLLSLFVVIPVLNHMDETSGQKTISETEYTTNEDDSDRSQSTVKAKVSTTPGRTTQNGSADENRTSTVSTVDPWRVTETTLDSTANEPKTYDIRTLADTTTDSYVLTSDRKKVALTIQGNVLSVPEGCELYSKEETANGVVRVGQGSNQKTLSGTDMQKLYIYVPDEQTLLETPLIFCKDDGTYTFADFSKKNNTFYEDASTKVTSADASLKQAAASITAGANSDYEKVRAVHDWIAANCAYDKDVLSNPDARVRDDAKSFAMRRGVCENFAKWTCDLLTDSGVECLYVTGIGLNNEDDSYEQKVNHAWNIVKIDGNWYPMDVTWDCGNVYENGTITVGPSQTTYFLDPHAMNLDHILIQ